MLDRPRLRGGRSSPLPFPSLSGRRSALPPSRRRAQRRHLTPAARRVAHRATRAWRAPSACVLLPRGRSFHAIRTGSSLAPRCSPCHGIHLRRRLLARRGCGLRGRGGRSDRRRDRRHRQLAGEAPVDRQLLAVRDRELGGVAGEAGPRRDRAEHERVVLDLLALVRSDRERRRLGRDPDGRLVRHRRGDHRSLRHHERGLLHPVGGSRRDVAAPERGAREDERIAQDGRALHPGSAP